MGIIKLKKINEEAKAVEELESGTVAEEVISAEKAATDENVLPREALFENKDKKSMHQDIFRFNDGTIRQFVSGEPKNYVDRATKKHKKIQTCLCKNSEGDLECRKNIFETRFYAGVENGRIYSMKKDNCEVTLTAEDIKKVGSAVEQPNDEGSNKAVLKDVRSGVDIEYEVEPNRIKENIIVKERQENYIFDFGINLTNLDISVAEDYKALELKDKDTGATVFRIPSPVMYDANGEYSDEVSYEISKNDETLSVKVVAEPEYFNAPERAFPVVIDPQVTVATDEVTSYKVYRKMRGSSGYTYNWNETTSQYIKVSRDSAYDYKTVIKIDKAKIGLLDSTINSVKLRLRKYSISQYGNILVNGSSVYMGSGDILVNITSTFKSYSDTAEFGITVEPYSAYINGLFYASGSYAPELEIEYLGNNDKPALKSFNLASGVLGTLNLGTGELVTSFESVSAKNLSIEYGISHIYKQSVADFGLGDNFRLNLHERFVKNYSNCDYTDPSGTKILFTEHYYYLDDNNNKQYISKWNVVSGIDGQLTYQSDEKTYEVQAEYRSSTGLKVIPKLENVTNAELVEQRSDELKQLENQVQSYENVLDDYVLVNMNNKEITCDYPISEKKYNALKNPSYCCLVLSKAEALQYKSLKEQRDTIYKESMNNYMPGLKVNNTLNRKTGTGYTQLFSLENSFAVLNNQLIEYMDQRAETDSLRRKIDSGAQQIIEDTQFYNINQEDEFKFYANKDSKTIFGTDLVDMFFQRNLLIKQIEEAKVNLNIQIEQLDGQIRLIEDKRTQQIKQFNDYYKEYVNLKYKLNQTVKHMPVNYLTDGTLYKGFNDYGDLVSIFDGYGNALNIEYADSGENTRRIKRVYDGENKTIEFEYNSEGRLREITDARGGNIKFSYNAPTLVNGSETSPTSDRLGKVEFSDGRIIEFGYIQDTRNGKYEIYEVVSGDKLKARLNYTSNKLSSVYEYSLVSNIKHGSIVESNEKLIDYHTLTYAFAATTIVDGDGNKEKYLFDEDEFVVGEFIEENNRVVSAKLYDYVPYTKNNIQYAKKDSLNKYALTNFNFDAGDTESTILNAFNNPTKTETNARKLNADGTVTQKVTTEYTYNDEQKVTEEKTTIAVTGKSNVYAYKKYSYNVQHLLMRTESYVEGEEKTSGRRIEETVYDEKGNVIKSFAYNSLDSSSKIYKESEYGKNGQILAEIDETGENKRKYEYVDGTNIVRSVIASNGSKLSYGHDEADRVTGITQSTKEGEGNSNSTSYTYGEVTEVRSGNNVVEYEYDYKRRLTKVKVNPTSATDNYISYEYTELKDSAGKKTGEKITATYKKRAEGISADKIEKMLDVNGNVLSVKVNGEPQTENIYTSDNKISLVTDGITGKKYRYKYDALGRLTNYEVLNSEGTYDGYAEELKYDKYGKLGNRIIFSSSSVPSCDYYYKENAARDLDFMWYDRKVIIRPKTDVLGRNIGKTVMLPGGRAEEIITYRKVGDHATQMPSTIRYGDNTGGTYGIRDCLKYAYDEMGNIAKVYENGELSVRYTYDKLGRLVREDNKSAGETSLFDYDNNGNILTKRTLSFTLKGKEEVEELISTAKEYTYDRDRLLSYNGETFVYDGLGNPTTYRGKTLTWSKGRQLTNYNRTAFAYNGQGQRISKGNISYIYGSDGNLVSQSDGLSFMYDATGVVGIKYDNKYYAFRKDILGNVIGILDENGINIVQYRYDAWGICKIEKDTSGKNLGELNPFRYRGYYYDTETKLYYLKTRYYDPEIGRFITIDDVTYLAPDTINGLNLYAYCNNNPVMNVDPEGTSWWGNVKNWFRNAGRRIGNFFKTSMSILGIGGRLTLRSNSLGFDIGIDQIPDSDLMPKGIGDIFKEGWNGLKYFVKEVVWDDWIVDKFGREFLKGIVWDKGIVPAWNWLKQNWRVALDGLSAVTGIGGGVVSILSAIGIISIPVAGQIILGVVSIGFGIYGLGRAFGWW